jgi:cytosine/adenosine deaminase-related metal-dependent hydrolase
VPVLSGHILARDAAGHWQAAPGRLSHSDGVIADVAPGEAASDTLILPALSNAHDHGRGLRTVAFGAGDDALEVWIAALGREPATDPYLRAAVAFARMAEAGIATLNHCHNTADPNRLVEEAEAVSRAARDVGRARGLRRADLGAQPADLWRSRAASGPPAPAQAEALRTRPRSGPTPAEQFAMVEEIAAFEHDLFHVQYGPVGPQWVDDAMLARIAEASARTGRRVHMHLFETAYQKEWAGAAYPGAADPSRRHRPPVGAAHGGPWRPSRRCRLRAAGRAGRACLGQHLVQPAPSVRPSAGGGSCATGSASASASTAWPSTMTRTRCGSLRVAWRLARGWGAEEVLTLDRLLDAALIDGRRAILGPADTGGTLTEGAPADILTLDTARITADVVEARQTSPT